MTVTEKVRKQRYKVLLFSTCQESCGTYTSASIQDTMVLRTARWRIEYVLVEDVFPIVKKSKVEAQNSNIGS